MKTTKTPTTAQELIQLFYDYHELANRYATFALECNFKAGIFPISGAHHSHKRHSFIDVNGIDIDIYIADNYQDLAVYFPLIDIPLYKSTKDFTIPMDLDIVQFAEDYNAAVNYLESFLEPQREAIRLSNGKSLEALITEIENRKSELEKLENDLEKLNKHENN
jgi:hypothetical protein